jgi:hypothetical protein
MLIPAVLPREVDRRGVFEKKGYNRLWVPEWRRWPGKGNKEGRLQCTAAG